MPEPRDPLLKVLIGLLSSSDNTKDKRFGVVPGGCPPGGEAHRRSNVGQVFTGGRLGLPGGRPALGNDPSAGSPTETLLRLLLPLNDRV
jgi:hypothetical protein